MGVYLFPQANGEKKKKKRILSSAALGLALFTSASAFAYDGYVTGSVSLRAGPDASYPRVARLRPGTSVVIEGCVDDWSWCDVSDRHDRGWVSASHLQHEYQGNRVLVPQYGVQIGIPVISFVFGSYWDDHYRSRSWYHERQRYSEVSTRYYHSGGDSHRGATQTRAPSQAPASPSWQTETASQPAHHAQASAATTTVTHAQPAAQPATREHAATQTRPAVEHHVAESQAAPAHHHEPQQQGTAPSQPAPSNAHQSTKPATQQVMPTHVKAPPAQEAGNPKARDQAAGKDKNKDQGGGKNENKDHGGG